MGHDRKYTAYCGLFCRDCIPSNEQLFKAAEEFEKQLTKLDFEKYAEAKSEKNAAFKDYSKFINLLGEIKALECSAPCAQGGCKEDCKIRECVLSKGYEGCWKCDDHMDCKLLFNLKKYHGPTINYNIAMIQKYGVDDWSDKRGKHYQWSYNLSMVEDT